MARHTPAPWERTGHRQISSQTGVICEVFSHMGIDEADANERLIAAAPSLLEALRICRGNVASLGPAGALEPYAPYRQWLAMIDAALTQAAGERMEQNANLKTLPNDTTTQD